MGDVIGSCHQSDDPITGNKNSTDKDDGKIPITIRASIFFDGTGNNRTNTQTRLDSIFGAWNFIGSYSNDNTNVSKMENYLLKDTSFDNHIPIYIEGIGTIDGGTDDVQGMAYGVGNTGIIAKVQESISQLLGKIKTIPCDNIISNLRLDVFGFSRGAAAARYFIYVAKIQKTIEQGLTGYTVNNVEVFFAGLFDTVASYGKKDGLFNFGIDHSKDAELKLNSITIANTVIQLVAADEYRENFPLTNVNSNGTQILLPGAHSDIGGGYTDNMDEADIKILAITDTYPPDVIKARFQREIKWVKDNGWYEDDNITDDGTRVILNRNGIRNTYSIIPLSIMTNYAKKANLPFNDMDMHKEFKQITISPDLKLMQDILGPNGTGDWKSNIILLKKIRNNYCHFSAFYGDYFDKSDPAWDEKGIMNGNRKRVIYDS